MNIIKSYNKLSVDFKKKLKSIYPDGFEDDAKYLTLMDGLYMVIPFSENNENYIIKIKKLVADTRNFDPSKIKWKGNEETLIN